MCFVDVVCVCVRACVSVLVCLSVCICLLVCLCLCLCGLYRRMVDCPSVCLIVRSFFFG